MIFTRLEAHHFRSLALVDQRLGRFQALVGPNASGKTTFLDAFNFLKDLMRSRGDIREAVSQRGADFSKLLWKGEGSSFEIALEARIPDDIHDAMGPTRQIFDHVRYELTVSLDVTNNEIGLDRETLWLFTEESTGPFGFNTSFLDAKDDVQTICWEKRQGRNAIVNKQPGGTDHFYPYSRRTFKASFKLGRTRSGLAHVPADPEKFGVAMWFKELIEDGVQNFILDSQKIRQPSPPGSGNRFKADGSNLPWVVEELRNKDFKQFEKWLNHICTALEDISDIRTIERQEDRHRYLVVEYLNGSVVPSWMVSDGTLRLLALTIPAYIKGLKEIFLIEEPENGIHPRAMETVTQSLKSIYDSQVLIATHSPIIIDQLKPDQIICFAKNPAGATDTVVGNRHPRLQEWKSGKPSLGVLAASGILS